MLLTGSDGRRMLVDGGMRASYSEHVAPALGSLCASDKALEVVYVPISIRIISPACCR